MPEIDRDREIIEHILRYCDQVDIAHNDFGYSRERFFQSPTYQNSISMCILQIGELAGHLSDEFKADNAQIPWRRIRGMRNYVAHDYGSIDLQTVWLTATNSIGELRQFCTEFLSHL